MTRVNCIYNDAWIDGEKYTLFHCERLSLERTNREAKVGVSTVENFCLSTYGQQRKIGIE